ncbi:MAG: hypothetical protein ACOX7F_00445 [Eubacteriales bacterium]|jgi:ribosomal protein L14E/L6E/L27E
MDIAKSCIVRATAGRDKGKLFVVLEVKDGYVLLVNGKGRRLENPKRKKLRHVQFCSQNLTRVGEKVLRGDKLTNAELRRTLSELERNDTE